MAKVNIDKLTKLIEISKEIIKSQKKVDYLNQSYALDSTNSQRGRIRNKQESECEYMEKQLHELHCIAVEIGIADLDESRYGEKTITTGSGWHEQKILKRRPNI